MQVTEFKRAESSKRNRQKGIRKKTDIPTKQIHSGSYGPLFPIVMKH